MEPKSSDAGGRPARSALLERIAEWLADAGPDIGPSHTVRDELVRRELEAVRLLKDCRLELEAAGLAAEPKAPVRSALLEKFQQLRREVTKGVDRMGDGCDYERIYELFDQLAAGLAAGDRPPLQIDELFQELELALWDKIGNTWEATQGQRVEAFLRKHLRVAGDRPSLDAVPYETYDKCYEQLTAAIKRAEDAERQLAVGARPAPQEPELMNVEELRANCHGTYNGGWHDNQKALEAFHHGMDTVCNVLASNGPLYRALPVSSPAPVSPRERRCVGCGQLYNVAVARELGSPDPARLCCSLCAKTHLVAAPVLPEPPQKARCTNCDHVEPHTKPTGFDINDGCTHPMCNCGYDSRGADLSTAVEQASVPVQSQKHEENQALPVRSMASAEYPNKAVMEATAPADTKRPSTDSSPGLPAVLGTLPRYRLFQFVTDCWECPDGEWVKFEDVARIVSALQHEIAQWKAGR